MLKRNLNLLLVLLAVLGYAQTNPTVPSFFKDKHTIVTDTLYTNTEPIYRDKLGRYDRVVLPPITLVTHHTEHNIYTLFHKKEGIIVNGKHSVDWGKEEKERMDKNLGGLVQNMNISLNSRIKDTPKYVPEPKMKGKNDPNHFGQPYSFMFNQESMEYQNKLGKYSIVYGDVILDNNYYTRGWKAKAICIVKHDCSSQVILYLYPFNKKEIIEDYIKQSIPSITEIHTEKDCIN